MEIVVALITVCVPAIVTLITNYRSMRLSRMNSAKQSILQLIMEDEFRWEIFGKLPNNSSEIHCEYDVYHKNGGDGEITLRVDDYDAWFKSVEKKVNKKKGKKGK